MTFLSPSPTATTRDSSGKIIHRQCARPMRLTKRGLIWNCIAPLGHHGPHEYRIHVYDDELPVSP